MIGFPFIVPSLPLLVQITPLRFRLMITPITPLSLTDSDAVTRDHLAKKMDQNSVGKIVLIRPDTILKLDS